jgi:signal peptidase I
LLYAGRARLGVILFFAMYSTVGFLGWTGLVQSVEGAAAAHLLGLAYVYGGIVLAYKVAKRSVDLPRRSYNRWWVYAIALCAMLLVRGAIVLNREAIFGYGVYRVPSVSMQPTLIPGDFIVSDTRPGTLATVRRGDVVSYLREEAASLWLSRVVAMEGDVVEYDHEFVSVNGEVILSAPDGAGGPGERARLTLKLGEVFFLSDNVDQSIDSRRTGAFQRSVINGVVTHVWFSFPTTERGGPVLNDVDLESEALVHVEHD